METLNKQRSLSLLNMASVILAIGVNYYSQIYKINGNTVSDLSKQYFNLFTPAGYAFSIWGFIFLGILIFAGYQVYLTYSKSQTMEFISQTGGWFALANLGNAAWIIAWLYNYTLLSVAIMLIILLSFIKIILNTNMNRWYAPLKTVVFAWWPIGLYAGWISVATIANISAFLAKAGWDGAFLNEMQWTIVMVVIATLLNVIVIYKRRMRIFALVGAWALIAIYVRHMNDMQLIAVPAMIGALLISIYALYQHYKNRGTNPLYKKLT
ncbi:MAG: hypothetical protein RBS07_16060 [Lentimicrobium sp.]|jgi:hypothetical protein|nr:hypothetical protein [Lentimicrobium sp.]